MMIQFCFERRRHKPEVYSQLLVACSLATAPQRKSKGVGGGGGCNDGADALTGHPRDRFQCFHGMHTASLCLLQLCLMSSDEKQNLSRETVLGEMIRGFMLVMPWCSNVGVLSGRSFLAQDMHRKPVLLSM